MRHSGGMFSYEKYLTQVRCLTKVCVYIKSRLLFKVRISQKVKVVIMQNLRCTKFYIKTSMLQDFHICISEF